MYCLQAMRFLFDIEWWSLLIFVRFVSACARTMPTTAPIPGKSFHLFCLLTKYSVCQTCSLDTIQLTPMNGAGTLTPGNSGVTVGPNGCNQLTVTCDAGDGNTAFMQACSLSFARLVV